MWTREALAAAIAWDDRPRHARCEVVVQTATGQRRIEVTDVTVEPNGVVIIRTGDPIIDIADLSARD